MILKILIACFIQASLAGREFMPSSFRINYKQTIKKKISGKIQNVSGVIDYRHPGKIRFEQSSPEKILWVTDREKSWYYQAPFLEGEPGQLKISSGGGNPLVKFFDVLKNGLTSNQNYHVKKAKDNVELVFKKEELVSRAVLTFSGAKTFANLKFVEVTETNGRVIKLAVEKIALNPEYPAKHFTFEPPKNTHIIQ